MRCKVGDLAVLVYVHPSWAEHLGRIVTCLELDPVEEEWKTDYIENGKHVWAYDRDLRPIRDEPGQDETLGWKSLPNKIKETT